MAAENRVRIIIETDNTSGRRGIQETVQDLDSLAAKGRGVDLNGALRLDAGAVTQPAATVGAALDDVGAKGKKAGADTGAAMGTASDAIKKVGAEADNSGKTGRTAMRNLGSGASEAKAQAEALGANLSDIRALAVQLAPVLIAAFGVDQVIAFASQVVGAAMAMEQLAATYKAVFKDNSAEQMRYAASMADAFGKSLLDVAGAYKKFAASAEAVGLSTDHQRRTFEAVTAAITKVGGSSHDVAGALLALEQMLSKGTVQAEEYRQQFAERIPGALKMGADALGVTTAAFQKMMENGEVISNDFIPKLTTQLEKFGDGWQATADTATANAERLKNSFLELSNSSALTGLVTFTEKIGTAFNKNLTHNLEQFTVTYRAMVAEAKGDLSPFATWSNSLEGLKVQLDAIDQRKSTYIKDLKDQAQGLADALVNVQTHQVDFGPSGETVDQLRAKLKWFQDQITALTGQTWVVNVVAQVDNSQLIQAKAYIQDLIKGTTEYKTRSLEAKQYSLDNAVNIVTNSKTTVETKLANPNLDLREADVLSRELESLNGQLADANLGYKELQKQRETLARQQIKDNGAVAGLSAGRGGVNESELDKTTRATDAHALSVARQKDAYAELQAGLVDLPGYYSAVQRIQEAENNTVKTLTKSTGTAANAMERFESRGAASLQSMGNQVDALSAQLGGDSLTADLAKIDKRYDQLGATIKNAMIGAKGDVADYQAALAKLEEARALEKQIVQVNAWEKAMGQAATTLKELGRLTADPDLLYAGATTELQQWAVEQEKTVKAVYADESQRVKALGDLKEMVRLKDLENQKSAFAELAGVSEAYWKSAWTLLDEHLKKVKDNCDSEYAYEAYAAKKRSELRKQEIEARLEYETGFLATLKDALSLEFGLYKDAGTRRRDAWVSLSKEIASGVHDLSDAVAGGATDAFKAWITGSGSMADAFKSAMDSMLDYLMTIIQKMIAYALENYIIIPIVESVVGADSSASLTGSGSGSGSDSLTSSAMSKITSKATDYGISKGLDYVSGLFSSSTSAASSLASSAAGAGITLAGEVAPWAGGSVASSLAGSSIPTMSASYGTVASTLGTGLEAGGTLSSGALAGTSAGLGTVLGVVGGVAALGGLLIMGTQTTKTETKTGSGIRVAIIGDSTNVTGTDYYKVTESSMLGGSSTSHEIRSTGAADSETTNAVNDALGTYTTAIKAGFKEFGVETADSLANFYFPEWDVAPGQEEDYYRNVSNAKVGKILADAGLTDAFAAIAKEGEPWIDQLSRLCGSLATVKNATDQMGLSLESLAGEDYISGLVDKMLTAGDSAGTAGMDFDSLAGVLDEETLASLKDMQAQAAATGEEVQATNEQLRQLALAQYASEIVDAFGSADAATAAFDRYYANAYSSTEQATRLMQYYAKGAGEALGALGTSGVTLENFWSAYRAAMENSALSADQLKAWDDAAQWVEAWDTSLKSAGQAWDSTNQTLIDGINDQIAALEKQRDAIQETLDLWSDFLTSIKDLRQAIKWDSDLTDLSPYEQYQQKKAAFDETAAKAKAGDKDAMAELPDLTQAYLDASRDYYASSENYFADFEHADATLASLEQFAQVQVDQAQAQLDAINNEIAILTLQVDQLTLVNANLASLGSAWGDGVSAIVSAINDSSFSSAYADSMAAANAAQAAAAASLLATMSGGASSAAAAEASGFDWSSLFAGNDLYTGSGVEEDEDGTVRFVGMADGGLVTGGVPGLDSVPTMLMPGERVFSVAHSRIIERLATSGQSSATDTSGIERRLDRVAATSALASRANQEALEGLRRELSVVANKLSRDARRPQGRAR
ncbi:tape measure protein [Solidesulfovibrio sp.]